MMPDWFADVSLLDITTTVVVLAAIGGVAAKGWPAVKLIVRLSEALLGSETRPGEKAKPGLIEHLETIDSRLDGLEKVTARSAADSSQAAFHSQPNHGSSAYDALMRKIDALATVVDSLKPKED